MLRAIDFIGGGDISEREASLCFVWSRMATSGPSSARDDLLPFEGMLEAFCRLSMIKALPTDCEVSERGCANAGEWLLHMRAHDDTRRECEQMLQDRRVGWGGEATQPLDRCVAATLSMVIHTIEAAVFEGACADESDGELSASEISTWLRHVLGA